MNNHTAKYFKVIFIFSIILYSCDLPTTDGTQNKAREVKHKIEIKQIHGINSKDAGFEFCLDKAIKHPYSKNMDLEIKLKNGIEINSIYKQILSPSIGKGKEGKRCFAVRILSQTTHQRHPKAKDAEIFRLIKSNWNQDSIEHVNLIVYESTYSDEIYSTRKFDLK
jgi:hypothetical protein